MLSLSKHEGRVVPLRPSTLRQAQGERSSGRTEIAVSLNTPYINTIPADQEPDYRGDREIERRIKSTIRWNAMAMVVKANRVHDGIGGHISTYASSATLYEVGFNHFFRGNNGAHQADQIFFQG